MKTKMFILLLFCLFSLTLSAQLIDVKGKIKNKSINRADQRTDQGIDKGLDKVEEGVVGIFKGKDKDKDKENDEEATEEDSGNNNKESERSSSKKQDETKLQSYSKYDFVPGEKVIFYEDFSQDAIGDFPALWNTNGSAEVVTTNLYPGNWMKYIMSECVWTDALLQLPDNYTIEFDVIPIQGEEQGMAGYHMRLMQAYNVKSWDGGATPGHGGFQFTMEYYGTPRYNTWLLKDDCGNLGIDGAQDDEALK